MLKSRSLAHAAAQLVEAEVADMQRTETADVVTWHKQLLCLLQALGKFQSRTVVEGPGFAMERGSFRRCRELECVIYAP